MTAVMSKMVKEICYVDECAAGSNQCHANADCFNYKVLYDCTCKDGYEGEYVHGTDIEDNGMF